MRSKAHGGEADCQSDGVYLLNAPVPNCFALGQECGERFQRCKRCFRPHSWRNLSQKFGRLRHVPKTGLSAEPLGTPASKDCEHASTLQ